jgi:hypothetical protein
MCEPDMITALMFDESENERSSNLKDRGRTARNIPRKPSTFRYPQAHTGRNDSNRRRSWKKRVVLFGILLLLLAILGGVWINYVSQWLQSYTPFTGTVPVGQVTVATTRQPDQLKVQLTLFNPGKEQKSSQPFYLIQGNKVELKYKYVVLSERLALFGLHSGYILSGFQGYKANSPAGKPLLLNAAIGNHSNFSQMPPPLISLQSGSLPLTADGKLHILMMSQTGLYEL